MKVHHDGIGYRDENESRAYICMMSLLQRGECKKEAPYFLPCQFYFSTPLLAKLESLTADMN